MGNRRKYALYLLLLLCFVGCTRPIKNQADLIAYVADPGNGLSQSKNIGGATIGITYRPWQLLPKRPVYNKQEQQFYDTRKDRLLFVLTLARDHKELLRQLPFDDYSRMVQVLSFRMIPMIKASSGNRKSVAPIDCVFQQTYGAAAENQVLIVFDRKQLPLDQNVHLTIAEFGLNLGQLDFDFDGSKLDHIINVNI